MILLAPDGPGYRPAIRVARIIAKFGLEKLLILPTVVSVECHDATLSSAIAMARKNPRRNISRIDMFSESGSSHGGWEVRMQRRGKKYEKFFADGQLGGRRAALQAAKTFRDDLEQRLKRYTIKELAKKPSVRNTSGVVGVRKAFQIEETDEYVYTYAFWIAQWIDGKGKRKTRSFSVDKYGDGEAYQRAVQARIRGVSQAKRTL